MERYPLHSLLSPLNAQEWRNLNENWDKIKAYFNSVQRQINILAGGEEVDEVLNRIEEAITNANTSVEEAISSLDDELQRVLSEIADQINLLTPIVNDAITATTNANTATANVGIALNELDAVIESYNVIGTWDSSVAYKKHNVVTYAGASYRALVDNTNVTVTDVDTWVLLAAKGEKGDTGSQGPQGVQGPQGIQGIKGDKGDKGEMGTGINIVGNLSNPSELPAVGSLGDAYLINGNLYVWNGTAWEDAGNIQGPKGDKGDKGDTGAQGPQGVQGPKGDKGDKGDTGPAGSNANVTQASIENALGYTPANQTDVTQHLDDVGDVNQLQTTNKVIVGAINEVKQYANDGKGLIATAINGKGGTATSSDTFSQLASKITAINTTPPRASGTITSSTTKLPFTLWNSDSEDNYHVTVSGLSFRPKKITLFYSPSTWEQTYCEYSNIRPVSTQITLATYSASPITSTVKLYNSVSGSVYINDTGFRFPFPLSGVAVSWVAEG